MTRASTNVHFDSIRKANVLVSKYETFVAVGFEVTDNHTGNHNINIFCADDAETAIVMAAMATAAREYFGNAEPEPDWDSVAAEMDTERHMEDARGI